MFPLTPLIAGMSNRLYEINSLILPDRFSATLVHSPVVLYSRVYCAWLWILVQTTFFSFAVTPIWELITLISIDVSFESNPNGISLDIDVSALSFVSFALIVTLYVFVSAIPKFFRVLIISWPLVSGLIVIGSFPATVKI